MVRRLATTDERDRESKTRKRRILSLEEGRQEDFNTYRVTCTAAIGSHSPAGTKRTLAEAAQRETSQTQNTTCDMKKKKSDE